MTDSIRWHGGGDWQYRCSCGYRTIPVTIRLAELVGRIHQHRHAVGRIRTTYPRGTR